MYTYLSLHCSFSCSHTVCRRVEVCLSVLPSRAQHLSKLSMLTTLNSSTALSSTCCFTFPSVLKTLGEQSPSILRGTSPIKSRFDCSLQFNRCESFNGLLRLHNIHSNRHASSYDIAVKFRHLENLRYLLHGGQSRCI